MKHKRLNALCKFLPVFIVTSISIGIYVEMAAAQQVPVRNWIGLEYNFIKEIPFFKKKVGQSSRLLPNHSYGVSDYIKGGRHYIFLEKLLDTGSKRFKIIQALDPGKVSIDENMDLSGLCRENGKTNEYIIAVVKMDTDDEVLKNIRKAWRIDINKGLFTPVDPKKITCINEGYGL
jgi:hypothetical protein